MQRRPALEGAAGSQGFPQHVTHSIEETPVVYKVKCKDMSRSSAPRVRRFEKRLYAINTAYELESIVKVILSGGSAECKFECVGPNGIGTCVHCHPMLSCAARVSALEFLADTGSEEDLLSASDKRAHYPRSEPHDAETPVNLITANGPTSADKTANVEVPELDSNLDFYLLKSTPPVVSVGKRCLDQGNGFRWPPYRKPFFAKLDGKKLRCRLGRVPVFGGGSYAFPARSQVNSGAQALSEAPSRSSVEDGQEELDEWLEEQGREGVEVAPDEDEGFTQ